MTKSAPHHCTDEGQPPGFHPERGVSGQAKPAGSSGLVSSKTSHTSFSVDPRQSRVNRMQRGTLTAARLHHESSTRGGFRYRAAMLTLTYRPGFVWLPDHIAALLTRVRQWCNRRGIQCRYVWVLELTKAGVPHYHAVFWLPRGVSMPKPDKQGWWPHGMTRIEWARNAVGYVAKYASKGNFADKYPKGARIHGVGGLDVDSRNERIWWLCPSWVREHWPDFNDRPRRAKGGGWLSLATGHWVPSPYEVSYSGGRIIVCLASAQGGSS